MAPDKPEKSKDIEISLDDALQAPALKTQQEEFPWKEKYEKLDYSTDDIPATEIKEKGKGPHTLTSILYPGLRRTNDRKVAMDKLNAIWARLVQVDFNPHSVRTGYIIRLEDKVLYIERPKAKKGQRLGLQLQRGAEVVGSYERLKPVREIARDEILEDSQKRWENLRQVIDRSITYDAIVALYGKKYTNRKLNFEKRKQIWETEMGETDPFTGNAVQNREILKYLKERLSKEKKEAGIPARPEEETPPEEAAPAEEAAPEEEASAIKEAPAAEEASEEEILQKEEERAEKRAKYRAEAERPITKTRERQALWAAYLADIIAGYRDVQRAIYNALSPADQENIEALRTNYSAIILVRNGYRYQIRTADAKEHLEKLEIRRQDQFSGEWVHPNPETADYDRKNPIRDRNRQKIDPTGEICDIADLRATLDKIDKTYLENFRGNVSPERPHPFSYPNAEAYFKDEEKVDIAYTPNYRLRYVSHKIIMRESERKIQIQGKDYVLAPDRRVKDVYETDNPNTVRREISCYPADAVGDRSRVDTIEILFSLKIEGDKPTQTVLTATLASDRSIRVNLPPNHPALQLEVVS